MQTGVLTLLKKTVTLMESLGFLWTVFTGFELNLWRILQQERSQKELRAMMPEWDPILLDHWFEQAKINGLVKERNGKYSLTRIGNAVDFYREYGLEALYKEFTLYWGPIFAELPKRIVGDVNRAEMKDEMNNELISKASRASEIFVWPLLKERCKKEGWKKVLDIGCGEGVYLRKIMEEFSQTSGTGVDINSAVIERAAALAKPYENRLQFQCFDIFHYQGSHDQYDCCLLNNNIYYFSREQRMELLRKIRSWIVPGGVIGILTALRSMQSSIPFLQTHIPQNLMSLFLASHEGFEGLPYEEDIITLLQEVGFSQIEVIPLPFRVSHYFFAKS